MKIYCYYTKAYQALVDEWFLPSLKDDYEVVLKVGEYAGRAANFMESDWTLITEKKVDAIIEAVQDNWDRVFLFSDPDIQFFRKTQKDILPPLRFKDIIFVKNSPDKVLCTGFFACRGNERTLAFWRRVRKSMNPSRSDQICANMLLRRDYPNRISLITRRIMSFFGALYGLSAWGVNPWKVRWGYLPTIFFGGGTLTSRVWNPGMSLPVPEDIVIHHANYTIGLDNKIAQLRYVKDLVESRKQVA